MEKIDIKSDYRYVVATMDEVPMFVKLKPGSNEYCLVDNITVASKADSKEAVESLIMDYKRKTHDWRDFAVLRIEVSYRIVD